MNLNSSGEQRSHWICHYKDGKRRIYFDSFGQVTPMEIQRDLKAKEECEMEKAVIQRNTDIVQHINTHVCGHLCLFVLASLAREYLSYQLSDGYTPGDW